MEVVWQSNQVLALYELYCHESFASFALAVNEENQDYLLFVVFKLNISQAQKLVIINNISVKLYYTSYF